MGDPPKSKAELPLSDQGSGAPMEREDGAPAYRVELPVFEGPLDLLLHLIQQHELDIFDIPIAFITQKYVEYLTLMGDLNIDVASEYLVMAATLTHIKSKMLLPPSPDEEEDEEDIELDPRAELVRRLLEYQKYKQAAEQLGERSILGRDVFMRGAPAPSIEGPAPLAPVGLFKLLDAFQSVLKRVKQTADHQIDVDRFSISDRINELSDILRERRRVEFEELFSRDQTRGDLIVTFLALLEMTRIRLIRLMQSGPLAPISIELAVSDGADEEEPGAGLEAAGGSARRRSAFDGFHEEPAEGFDSDASARLHEEPAEGVDADSAPESGDAADPGVAEPEELSEPPDADDTVGSVDEVSEVDASADTDSDVDGSDIDAERGSSEFEAPESEPGGQDGDLEPSDASDAFPGGTPSEQEPADTTADAGDPDAEDEGGRKAGTEGQTETD